MGLISIPVGTRRICLFTGIRYTALFPVSDCFGSGRRVPSVPVPCPDCPGTVFPDLHIGCEKLRRGAPPQFQVPDQLRVPCRNSKIGVNEIPALRRDACPQCRQMLRLFLMIRLPEQLFEIVSCELKYNYGKYRRKSQGPFINAFCCFSEGTDCFSCSFRYRRKLNMLYICIMMYINILFSGRRYCHSLRFPV